MNQPSALQAAQTAKRIVLASLLGACAVIATLLGERVAFQRSYGEAMVHARDAADLGRKILLIDERLTLTAKLAAETGERRWQLRYEANLPIMRQTIDQAIALAPPSIGRRFNAAITEANDSLVRLEREALVLGARGARDEARSMLEGDGYLTAKKQLEQASRQFRAAIDDHARAQAAMAQREANLLQAIAVGAGLLLFAFLWRRLTTDLGRTVVDYEQATAQIETLANQDALTGLLNRTRLAEELEQMIARCQRTGEQAALILLDIDRLRPINDQYGHAVGDGVLKFIGQRIAATVRNDEIAARLGADEFAIAVYCGDNPEAPMRAARRLINAISVPMTVDGHIIEVGATAGVAMTPADSADANDLLRKADVALVRAKIESRGNVRCFQGQMDAEIRERGLLQSELRQAIADGQIIPYFQPLVDLATDTVVGFEVLARWLHPTRGLIPPDTFIPVAEESGLIGELTFAVTRAALEHSHNWDQALTIAINVSQRQLHDPWLAEKILALLTETGFQPHRLEVEITENALVSDLGTAKYIIQSLRNQGVKLALDDFGTGYSSLSHLAELPFDKIKIDRSFIKTMREQAQSATIVRSIVGLGRSLGLPTLAEGVETVEDANTLRDIGCTMAQGYYYARPQPAADVPAMLRQLHDNARGTSRHKRRA